MRYIAIFIFTLIAQVAVSQSTNFGSSTSVDVGSNAAFYINSEASIEGKLANSGLLAVKGNTNFLPSSFFTNNAEASLTIEGNALLDGITENNGFIDILGETIVSTSALLNNNSGAVWSSEGDTGLEGTLVNDGEFFIKADSETTIDGQMENHNELTFESDVSLTGSLNNIGVLNVLGNLSVTGTGTYANPDGASSTVIGNLDQIGPFENGGIIEVAGDAVFYSTVTNNNEAVFNGTSSFGSDMINTQKMFLGGTTDFTGDLSNSGEIISFADAQLNFEHNRDLGDLTFDDVGRGVSIAEVILVSSADSIFIDHLSINISGKVTLPSNFVLIRSELAIAQGVLNTTNQENFLVAGNINVNAANSSAPAYVEGKMLAVTSDGETTFPMGINGFPNYLTLNSNQSGITVKVECKMPDPDSLFTDDETMGLAADVEWTIQSLSDSAEMSVSVEYSGVDFTNSPNFINARAYDATLQKYDKSDSLFHALRTTESNNANTGTSIPTEGTIKTSNQIWITAKPSRFALGLSPVLTEPEVYVPNIFTPGATLSDNQIFRPFIGGAIVNAITFTVFDSFNREVFSSSQSGEDIELENLGWDGTLKSGLEAPEGVYYYSISIEYLISEEVSDEFFNSGERDQTQSFSKLGSVMLLK
ncbi:hypothetical protein SAMN04488029_0111 [Reichenbachiella faecimaris]|uniref:C-terminal domain of CHU protein family protein n=1 Tax=Reichenbachiella faecimaris TaxID=692418 RepID=A0A1W2G5G8_REIFA|nr:hypothetical protein [Reichenbachiella faecimaris]SMD31774.1 hypothetical protein SAMN04488029_0111 [Reichenbachiella faecimaris]